MGHGLRGGCLLGGGCLLEDRCFIWGNMICACFCVVHIAFIIFADFCLFFKSKNCMQKTLWHYLLPFVQKQKQTCLFCKISGVGHFIKLKKNNSGISIGNTMICSDIWHKYHEWYFRIIIIEIWDNFETSRVVFMPNITYKWCLSIICLYYYPQNVCNFHM